MGIGAPVICGQNTGQHSKLEKAKIQLCFIFTVYKVTRHNKHLKPLKCIKINKLFFSVYVDMGTLASDTATLSFAFKGESTLRAWEVKVSQIPCAASYA